MTSLSEEKNTGMYYKADCTFMWFSNIQIQVTSSQAQNHVH
jgi:hypothetical protein